MVNSVRGVDGTGIFLVDKSTSPKEEKVIIHKKPIAGYDFLQFNPPQLATNNIDWYKFAIGHNRAVSKGRVCLGHTHPFQHGHITLVHNGHLSYTSGLDAEWNKFDVDSDLIAYAFSKHGYQTVIPKLEGAAALVWYDSNVDKLYLYRNKGRPLYFAHVKGQDTTLIASELPMLQWLAWRNDFEVEGKDEFDVGENQVIAFNKDARNVEVEKIEPTPKVTAVVVSATRDFFTKGDKSAKKSGKQMTKADSTAILTSRGISMGEEIEFMFYEMKRSKPNSRHGKLFGTLLKSPFMDVVSYGVEMDKFKDGEVIRGKVVWAEHAEENEYAIVVTGTASTGRNASIIPSDDAGEENDSPVIGPMGRLIPLHVFKEYTKHGCGECSTEISVQDAPILDWEQNTPLCQWCSRHRDAALNS